MLGSPEELNTAQKAQKQRRVAQRRKRACNVGNNKNKKYKSVQRLCALAAISGRINSMAAPVVPMMLAHTAPSARNAVLTAGRPIQLERI